jgi:hypothetical protein
LPGSQSGAWRALSRPLLQDHGGGRLNRRPGGLLPSVNLCSDRTPRVGFGARTRTQGPAAHRASGRLPTKSGTIDSPHCQPSDPPGRSIEQPEWAPWCRPAPRFGTAPQTRKKKSTARGQQVDRQVTTGHSGIRGLDPASADGGHRAAVVWHPPGDWRDSQVVGRLLPPKMGPGASSAARAYWHTGSGVRWAWPTAPGRADRPRPKAGQRAQPLPQHSQRGCVKPPVSRPPRAADLEASAAWAAPSDESGAGRHGAASRRRLRPWRSTS